MGTLTARQYVAPLERAGEMLVVSVKRYDQPRPAWGVHEITSDPACVNDRNPLGFHLRTVGLFPEPPVVDGLNPIRPTLAAEIAVNPKNSVGRILEIGLHTQLLFDYIGHQVIPIEWQKQWAEKDESTLARVEVWG